MYCVKNRIYCDVCNKSYIAKYYSNHLKSQVHVKFVLKDHCTIELVNIIANEARYQLRHSKNLYLTH